MQTHFLEEQPRAGHSRHHVFIALPVSQQPRMKYFDGYTSEHIDFSRRTNQISSFEHSLAATYSASAVDPDTHSCFPLYYDMSPLPRKMA